MLRNERHQTERGNEARIEREPQRGERFSVPVESSREVTSMAFGDDHGFGRGGMPPEQRPDPDDDREHRRQDMIELVSSSLEVLLVSLPMFFVASVLPVAIGFHLAIFASALTAAGLTRVVGRSVFSTTVSDVIGITAGLTGAFFASLAVESIATGAAIGGLALAGGIIIPLGLGLLGALGSLVVPRFLSRR